MTTYSGGIETAQYSYGSYAGSYLGIFFTTEMPYYKLKTLPVSSSDGMNILESKLYTNSLLPETNLDIFSSQYMVYKFKVHEVTEEWECNQFGEYTYQPQYNPQAVSAASADALSDPADVETPSLTQATAAAWPAVSRPADIVMAS